MPTACPLASGGTEFDIGLAGAGCRLTEDGAASEGTPAYDESPTSGGSFGCCDETLRADRQLGDWIGIAGSYGDLCAHSWDLLRSALRRFQIAMLQCFQRNARLNVLPNFG